jgi:hypothetical protein
MSTGEKSTSSTLWLQGTVKIIVYASHQGSAARSSAQFAFPTNVTIPGGMLAENAFAEAERDTGTFPAAEPGDRLPSVPKLPSGVPDVT